MAERRYLFTSESVSEGHPDKLADQISDAVLDACLRNDPDSHVGCETFTTTGMVLVGGEIRTHSEYIDVQEIARGVAKKVGYSDPNYGLDWESMAVMSVIHAQSPDIEQGVTGNELYEGRQGAGDQGMMFGFACTETPQLMPAPITYAHQILRHAAELRKNGDITWLRPDSKSQVAVEYEGHTPVRIDSVVVSHQHDDGVSHDEIKATLLDRVVGEILGPTGLLDKETKYFINPTGRFVIGGPHGDAGLTGRKVIVDTYGGMSRHGGGAFSGKDASKVDRSAAYMARYVAKNIVAAGLAERCEIELAYAIGVPFPVSITVETFGTGAAPEAQISKAVQKTFDLTPAGIVKALDLKKPIFQTTSNYGHFGRDGFTWEQTDKTEELKAAVG